MILQGQKKRYQQIQKAYLLSIVFDKYKRLGLAYYDGESLVVLTGASKGYKYLLGVQVEKFSYDPIYKSVASDLVNKRDCIVKEENPEISLSYTRQFSHTKSINLLL